jgi:hypothetical protein
MTRPKKGEHMIRGTRWTVLRRFMASAVLALCTFVATSVKLYAQSTSATVWGVVYDPSHAVLSDATVVVTSTATSLVRQTTSDGGGAFRLASLPPGRYDIRISRKGFETQRSEVLLPLDEDLRIEVTLALESVHDVVAVGIKAAAIDGSSTTLNRRITGVEASGLPVQGRLFLELAKLTPGIVSSYNTPASGSGFATAGQTGRNNTQFIDGLALDDAQTSTPRGSIPLEAIQDFVVVSNAPTAEFGQASGAIVSVLTKSGTNTLNGLGFVFRQNGAWNATPGAAILANPPRPKPDFSQTIAGGSLGGPISRNRAFFFASVEYTDWRSEFIVTSPVARKVAPNEPPSLPQRSRQPQILSRADWNLRRSSTLAVRYRLDRTVFKGRMNLGDADYGVSSRAFDELRNDDDVALIGTFVLSPSILNELHFQVAGREINWDPNAYCTGCASIEYPRLFLGKNPAYPNRRVEKRWQVQDALTFHPSGRIGDHLLKTGFDVSFVGVDFDQLNNRNGTFKFASDLAFDPLDARTYPFQYTRALGDSLIHVNDTITAAFVQDRWVPGSDVTLNLGVRWDYEHAIGVSGDTNNVAPRIGIAFDPWHTGSTSIRSTYGIYYDQVWLNVARNGLQGLTAPVITINSPGYQGDPLHKDDPYGFNPNPAKPIPLQNFTSLSELETPFSEQVTVGFQRALGATTSLAVDVVWARGRHQLVTHDLNYPIGSPPTRPDSSIGKINTVESRANSWYRGLQVGLARTASHGFGYSVAYTLAASDRDTEDANFVPQDQQDYGADRGPSLNDVRHRLASSWIQDLPLGFRFATIVTVQSALPYNVIVPGRDLNQDGNFNERPPGVARNSGRGTSFLEADLRASKTFRHAAPRVEVIAELFNVTNRRNWIYAQTQSYGAPLRPSGAEIPRQLQIGVRARF